MLNSILRRLKYQRIDLSNREWAILIPLMTHPNKIFSKANLEDKLYDFDSDVTSNTIEVYVHHLRAKLGKDFIEPSEDWATVWGNHNLKFRDFIKVHYSLKTTDLGHLNFQCHLRLYFNF